RGLNSEESLNGIVLWTRLMTPRIQILVPGFLPRNSLSLYTCRYPRPPQGEPPAHCKTVPVISGFFLSHLVQGGTGSVPSDFLPYAARGRRRISGTARRPSLPLELTMKVHKPVEGRCLQHPDARYKILAKNRGSCKQRP